MESFQRCFPLYRAVPLVLAVMSAGTALAQGTGTVSGTAVDLSQAVVARGAITLTNLDTGQTRTATTSDSGFFHFGDLVLGN